mmetsp:Transcript_4232/g.9551  ORF Transcript_4232/g.9551 Transcript_4232/m.9551 type:complete len:156 (+) Transcript_4232:11026-11493(+)
MRSQKPKLDRHRVHNSKDEPHCYICLEEGSDESGQLLMRGCSCRGESAGFGHVSCIVRYAEQKSLNSSLDLDEFKEPWEVCTICHQAYMNKLAVKLTTEFVTFVKENFPEDQLRQLVAHNSKLGVLPSTQENEYAAKQILSIIEQMKTSESFIPP